MITIDWRKAKRSEMILALEKIAKSKIMWQENYNNAATELENITNKRRLKIKIETIDEIIESALGYYLDDKE